MSDGPAPTPAPEPAPTPAPAAAPAPAPEPAPAAAPARDWMTTLPADLQGDASLGKYETLEAFARGHLDTKAALSRGGLQLPADLNDLDAMAEIYGKLGRPAEASGYEFSDKVTQEARDEFAPVAFGLGLSQKQAQALAEYDLQRLEGAMNTIREESAADLQTLKDEMGAAYGPAEARAQALFKSLFGEDAKLADEIDGRVGSATLVRGFMKLADQVGELPRVDGGGVPPPGGGVPDAQAEARLDQLQADASWRQKVKDNPEGPEAQERRKLMAAVTRHEMSGMGG